MNFFHKATRRFTKMESNLRASLCDFVDEFLWRNYADTLARPALRRANIIEKSGLHGGGGIHSRARDRREYRDFQCGEWCAAQTFALQRPGAAGVHPLRLAGGLRGGRGPPRGRGGAPPPHPTLPEA